jgi:probable HAF family extracellular repeat protein
LPGRVFRFVRAFLVKHFRGATVLRACCLILLFAPLLHADLAHAQTRYSLYPIRPFFSPSGMNDLGQLVGATFFDQPQGAIWTPGADPAFTLLGMPTDVAVDINNAGQVVGTHAFAANRTRAVVFLDSAYRDLGTLGGRTSSGRAINESGQVAGSSATVSGVQHAFLYDGVMHDLGALKGGWSYAYGMNDKGEVVGGATMISGHEAPTHPFLYSDGTMTDLSRFAAEFGAAYAINNLGQVVGGTRIGGADDHAFLYEDGIMTDLGTLGGSGSFAVAINDKGNIVGASASGAEGAHAFLYTNEKMTDLNALLDQPEEGWTVYQAYAINEHDQIAGFACRPHPDQESALDCASVFMTPVPEPLPWALWTATLLFGWAIRGFPVKLDRPT